MKTNTLDEITKIRQNLQKLSDNQPMAVQESEAVKHEGYHDVKMSEPTMFDERHEEKAALDQAFGEFAPVDAGHAD